MNELIIDRQKQDVGITLALYMDGFVLITTFVDQNLGYTFELIESLHEPIWPNRGHEFKDDSGSEWVGGVKDLVSLTDAIAVRYRIQVKD